MYVIHSVGDNSKKMKGVGRHKYLRGLALDLHPQDIWDINPLYEKFIVSHTCYTHLAIQKHRGNIS